MEKNRLLIFLLLLSILLILVYGSGKLYRTLFNKPQKIVEDKVAKNPIKEDLYKKIEDYANMHILHPIDAKIDRVWKTIPGYNGRTVDIEASYDKMFKDSSFDEKKLVYIETLPSISLDDLSPAPIYKGNPEKPMVSFLINVAWGNEYLPKILETLKNNHAKATFFLDGSWTKENPDLARSIKNFGHEIGSHAYSHPDLAKYSIEDTRNELSKTNHVIKEILDLEVKWFAPPSGSFNDNTVLVADQLNMRTILWTVDTLDWRKPDTQEMVQRVVREVDKGSMILMHPTSATAQGLEQIIKDIKAKSLHIGTVSELMSEDRLD